MTDLFLILKKERNKEREGGRKKRKGGEGKEGGREGKGEINFKEVVNVGLTILKSVG